MVVDHHTAGELVGFLDLNWPFINFFLTVSTQLEFPEGGKREFARPGPHSASVRPRPIGYAASWPVRDPGRPTVRDRPHLPLDDSLGIEAVDGFILAFAEHLGDTTQRADDATRFHRLRS